MFMTGLDFFLIAPYNAQISSHSWRNLSLGKPPAEVSRPEFRGDPRSAGEGGICKGLSPPTHTQERASDPSAKPVPAWGRLLGCSPAVPVPPAGHRDLYNLPGPAAPRTGAETHCAAPDRSDERDTSLGPTFEGQSLKWCQSGVAPAPPAELRATPPSGGIGSTPGLSRGRGLAFPG